MHKYKDNTFIIYKVKADYKKKCEFTIIRPSRSRTLLYASHNQFDLLKSFVQKIVVLKYEDNPLIDNKVKANNSNNKAKFKNLTYKVNVIYE
jgi:hypothetical protein